MPARLFHILMAIGVLVVVAAAAAGLYFGSAPSPRSEATATPSPTSTATPSPTPTATASATATPREPLEGVHIMLDPGHNGGNASAPGEIARQVEDGRGNLKACNTVGTSTLSGYAEHAFTWDVATRARDLLEAEGAEVSLTRDNDDGVGPCVDERGQAAADAEADVLVSIHANGSENPDVQGYFAIVASPPLNDAQGRPSRALARHLLGALDDGGFTPSTAIPDALSERADLGTLNWSERPAVILELAEMRNPEEAELAESRAGRNRYAEAVVAGLLSWAADRDD